MVSLVVRVLNKDPNSLLELRDRGELNKVCRTTNLTPLTAASYGGWPKGVEWMLKEGAFRRHEVTTRYRVGSGYSAALGAYDALECNRRRGFARCIRILDVLWPLQTVHWSKYDPLPRTFIRELAEAARVARSLNVAHQLIEYSREMPE